MTAVATATTQAAALLAALGMERGGWLQVKCFDRAGQVRLFWHQTPADLLASWPQLEAVNRQGFGVYFGPATYREKRGTKDNAAWLYTVHADLDGKDFVDDPHDWARGKELARAMLENLPAGLQPAVTVDTGHGLHCYWPLNAPLPATPENIEGVEAVNAALAVFLDSDPSVKDVSRVLRLPGLQNVNCSWLEDPEPLPVAIVGQVLAASFDLVDFAPILRDAPAMVAPGAPAAAKDRTASSGAGVRPGDDFNDRGDWSQLLTAHGWKEVGKRGDSAYWQRPGKDHGVSARLNRGGDGLLRVYTSSAAPLETNTSYSLFGAYTTLEHRGDFRAAVLTLADLGYGTAREQQADKTTPAKLTATAAPGEQIETLLQRLDGMQNGDRPAGLRALGDALAVLDAAAWATVRPGLLERAGLRAVDLDALRSDGQRRIEDQRRATITQQAAEAGESDDGAGYRVKYGVAGTPFLYLRKFTDKGVEDTLLAHFVPRIIAERVRHKANGETVRVFSCQLETARGVRVFDALPEELGDPRRFYTACLNAAGADAISKRSERPIRDAAMELADPERERSEIFEFVGWYEHGGRLVYLSAAGAIGTEDVLTVDLSGLAMGTGFATLANYGPRDDGDEALQTALEALAGPVRDCLGDRVMLPQLAAVALAPALRWAPIAELPVLHTMGATGKGKTRSARIVQAFYGLDKPAASWGWTQTAIEIVASSLRDCVVCIDDLKASTCDPRVAVKTMQRWADRRPRVRSNRSGSGLIGSPHIASLMLSNGEDLPSGEASVAARALFIPVQNEDFNEPAFRAAEGMLAALPTLTARYIAWLIEHQDSMNATAGASFREARLRYHAHLAGRTRINDAGRVASSCALLETGAALLAAWLRTVGWSEDQAGAWVQDTRAALEDLATVQAGMIDEESAAVLFLSSIAALLDTREAELVPVEPGKSPPPLAGCSPDRPGARLIGYLREGEILLDPVLAMGTVKELLRRQGSNRSLDTTGMYAQLRSGEYLSRWDGNRTSVAHILTNRTTKRLLVLKESAIRDQGDEAEDALLEEEAQF